MDKNKEATFVNGSNLEFKDLPELWRKYEWSDGAVVLLDNPRKLNVSRSGGHRVFTADGQMHYIQPGWIHLSWLAQDGEPSVSL